MKVNSIPKLIWIMLFNCHKIFRTANINQNKYETYYQSCHVAWIIGYNVRRNRGCGAAELMSHEHK